MATVVDPGGELRRRWTPWSQALSRAVAFEFTGALTAECGSREDSETVRRQHQQNGDLLLRLMGPGRN
jgi:hypothetical protein